MATETSQMDVVLKSSTTAIVFDVVTSVTLTAPSKVTAFPVESGADISDNIVNENISLSLRGWITAIALKVPTSGLVPEEEIEVTLPMETVKTNPLPFSANLAGIPQAAQALSNLKDPNKNVQLEDATKVIKAKRGTSNSLSPAEARSRLFEMRDAKEFLTITTPTAQYDNMVILKITEPRTVEHGGDLSSPIASWEVTLDLQRVRVVRSGTSFVEVAPDKEDKQSGTEGSASTENIDLSLSNATVQQIGQAILGLPGG